VRIRERLREWRGIRVSLRSSRRFYRGWRGCLHHLLAGDGRDMAVAAMLWSGENLFVTQASRLEGIDTMTWKSMLTRWSRKAARRGGLADDALSSMQEEEEDGGLLPIGGSHLSVTYHFITPGWTPVGW
jgi:hypothetical protein